MKKINEYKWILSWVALSLIGIWLFLPCLLDETDLWISRHGYALNEFPRLERYPELSNRIAKRWNTVPFFDSYDIIFRNETDIACSIDIDLQILNPESTFGKQAIQAFRAFGTPHSTSTHFYLYKLKGGQEYKVTRVSANIPIWFDASAIFATWSNKSNKECDTQFEKVSKVSEYELKKNFVQPNKIDWLLSSIFIVFSSAVIIASIRTIFEKTRQ